jgi:hypothetical protein
VPFQQLLLWQLLLWQLLLLLLLCEQRQRQRPDVH